MASFFRLPREYDFMLFVDLALKVQPTALVQL